MNEIKQAVILAGGQGLRLRPLTNDRPKPMILIHGKPLLEYMVEVLKENGIEEIVMLVGYMPEKIMEYFGDGSRFGLSIKYSIGRVEDDTGTRIRNAKEFLAPDFLLMYADNYWPFLDLEKMGEFFHSSKKLGLMVVYDNKDGRGEEGYKCNVMVGDNDRVLYYDRIHTNDPKIKWTEVGFFVFNRKILDFMPKDREVSLSRDILPDLVKKEELMAWKTNEVQYGITSSEDIPIFEDKLKSLRSQ
ncbi:nucleotidyltransferase family protein [bacterium]|nr:MAG: nucleotidyltransferase family protein [bacterium]